jgi:hypothetical protein
MISRILRRLRHRWYPNRLSPAATPDALWFLCVAAAIAVWHGDKLRFIRAYSVAFAFITTLGLGALFFVLIHHLVRADWSLVACRRMERITRLLYLGPLLFVPILLQSRVLYPRLLSTQDALLAVSPRTFYMSLPFFCARSISYLGVWGWLASWYRQGDPRESADQSKAEQMRRASGPSMVLFGLTTMLASFDWWMSLQPCFYSSIFGIYVFAGSVVAAVGLLVVVSASSQTRLESLTVEAADERHDLGKWLFGFVFFWGYIAFSQYLLIWYANLPHEIAFYATRWSSWKWLTVAVVLSHFVLPFIVLLSREAKRSKVVLTAMAWMLLVSHLGDVAWLILPALQPNGLQVGPAELLVLAFIISTVVFVLRSSPLQLPPLAAGAMRAGVVRDAVSTPRFAARQHNPDVARSPSHPTTLPRLLAGVTHLITELYSSWKARTAVSSWLWPWPWRTPTVARSPAPEPSHLSARRSKRHEPVHARIHPGRGLRWTPAVVAAAAISGGYLTASSFEWRVRDAAARRLAAAADASQAQQRNQGRELLSEYRWVARSEKVLRIPLERAKELVLREYAEPFTEGQPSQPSGVSE